MLKRLSIAFWFIIHLELEIDITPPVDHKKYFVTLSYVSLLWTQMWQDIQSSRRRNLHDTILPRLRSLDVIGDSRLIFNANLAERDDKVPHGVAVVKCAQLESLKSKLSSAGSQRNQKQEKTLESLTLRAEVGSPVGTIWDLEMIRPPCFWDRIDVNRFCSKPDNSLLQ